MAGIVAGLHDESKTLDTKVVILGHTGVGKTSLVNQYVRGQFEVNTVATIGAAFMKKDVVVNGWNIMLQIWDTAGQERFRSMAPMYYRGAHAAILVFDVSQPDTLDKVEGWISELQGHASEDILIVLAANKSDLRSDSPVDACVPLRKAQTYAKTINAQLFETSAKTGRGISQLFDSVAEGLLKLELSKRKDKGGAGTGGHDGRAIKLESGSATSSSGSGPAGRDRSSSRAVQGGCCS